MAAPAKGSLQLHLSAAATPRRVALAATMFNDMLVAAYPRLPTDSITMVVSNYDMVAGVRWQTEAGHKAVDGLVRFFETPAKEAKRRSNWRSAADVVADALQQLLPYQPAIRTSRKKLRDVDADFVGLMRQIAQRAGAKTNILRGPTLIYSRIYRVGRVNDGKSVKARIKVDDEPRDITIAESVVPRFFDAAKDGGVHVVHLDAGWERDEEGDLCLVPNASVLTALESWTPASGADLMQDVRRAPVQFVGDLDSVIEDLEGY